MTTVATAVIFDRPENSSLGQQGKTVEYRDEHGHTLAYLDYSEDGETARCNVFDPSTSRSRQYEWRTVARAAQIVVNHLARLGYQPDENPRQIEESESLQMALAGALGVDPAVIEAAQALTPAPAAEDDVLAAVAALPAESTTAELTAALPAQPAIIPDLTETHAAAAAEHGEWLRDVASPAPEFASVADAADDILGLPEDEIVRHWRDVRGTVWQFHLRSICPPAEPAAALRSFVADVNRGPARGGRTMNTERRFYCGGPEGWNVG